MLIKKLCGGLVLLGVCVSANASLNFSLSNALKGVSSLSETFVNIGGNRLTGSGQLYFNSDNTANYTANIGLGSATDWVLDFNLTTTTDTSGFSLRCPSSIPSCDTSGWIGLEVGGCSRITASDGSFYDITTPWGQFGIDAGGTRVAPNGGYASGFWLQGVTFVDAYGNQSNGGRGDINTYATRVPEPGVLALMGIGLLGLRISRRQAKS